MATQLVRKSPLAMIEERMPLFLSARTMIGGLAIVVAIAMLALVAGLRNAHRAEDAARARFADAQALAALPPASTDSIQEDLVSVNKQLATAEAAAAPAPTATSGDATTTMLIRTAQDGGLSVKAIAGVASGQTKVGADSYDSEGVRVTVDGTVGRIASFLDAVDRKLPSLIATLTTMTINEAGVAHAEIVFSTYTKVIPPTPVPVATKVVKK